MKNIHGRFEYYKKKKYIKNKRVGNVYANEVKSLEILLPRHVFEI